jgi:hypothetical protein
VRQCSSSSFTFNAGARRIACISYLHIDCSAYASCTLWVHLMTNRCRKMPASGQGCQASVWAQDLREDRALPSHDPDLLLQCFSQQHPYRGSTDPCDTRLVQAAWLQSICLPHPSLIFVHLGRPAYCDWHQH